MKLMELLPDFYLLSPEMEELQAGFEGPVEALHQARREVEEQFDPNTATWGLALWEEQYGLETDITRPLDYRRTRILSKLRGQGTTTVELVKNVAESFVNGLVEVQELPAEYRFVVKFVSTLGRPPNLEDVQAAIEEIRPAHLGYTFLFLYRTHRELLPHTHGHLGNYTHRQLREEELA